ncbi:tyrosine-type recombinase/integrase [Novosphingobium sp.]|uniref:tyrosine-type recombinase/integrase n=1 Tax=Novosphingobium sp. TaxID=1874826 RepID=UPI00286E0991|nr:tyrosine-type recombinase/integrase [Novosphingobium sp.]
MPRIRMPQNRFLPKYVSGFESQHGRERLVFRRKGEKKLYFKAAFGTKEFAEEYARFLTGDEAQPVVQAPRHAPGSVDDLVTRYFAVPTRLGPSEVTQAKVRAVIEDFRDAKGTDGIRRGERMVRDVTFEAIDKIIAKKLIKTGTGNKAKGGIHAARKLRKELGRLFRFAAKVGMVDRDPMEHVEKIRVPVAQRTKGFHSWTEDEITQYRGRWPVGTRERLAMELLLWTDQRRSDVVKMGRAQVRNGRIPIVQEKTGKTLWIALAPQLLEAIVAMKPEDTSPFCFLLTKRGGPFKKESFGNWFKRACVEAGLKHCTAHGLRKATLRRMADLEMANKPMKSVSGQSRDDTLAIYTEDANQVMLADAAITALARWEMTRDLGETDDEYRFTAND